MHVSQETDRTYRAGRAGALRRRDAGIARALDAARRVDDTYGELKCVLNASVVAGTASGAGAGAVQSLAQNGAPYVHDTDGGTFNFSGTATCTGEDLTGNTIGEFGPETVTITAHGTYTNLVCGTMKFDADASLNSGRVDLTAKFGIDFVDGRGKAVISHFDGIVTIDGVDQDVDDDVGDGVINFVPSEGDCSTSASGVTQWDLSGSFAADLAGDADANNSGL